MGAHRCLILNLYGLAISLAYPSGEEGDNLLIQISTCRHGLKGGRVSTLLAGPSYSLCVHYLYLQ
jgi:hypothetical protein